MLVQPGGHQAMVRSVEMDGQAAALARAGDTADVVLAGVDATALAVGAVVCHPDWPVPVAGRLEARIVVLDLPLPILKGRQVKVPKALLCSNHRSATLGRSVCILIIIATGLRHVLL